jgi:hypothetical protein
MLALTDSFFASVSSSKPDPAAAMKSALGGQKW